MLELDNLPGFAAKISGMSKATQQVDLGGFTFTVSESVTWAQAGTSGTLTVTDGAKVAHLTLIGTYATADFMLSHRRLTAAPSSTIRPRTQPPCPRRGQRSSRRWRRSPATTPPASTPAER